MELFAGAKYSLKSQGTVELGRDNAGDTGSPPSLILWVGLIVQVCFI